MGVAIIGLLLIVYDIGIFQRTFDDRSIVEDAIVGADYHIVSVNGAPTERIQHGFLVTKVPLAIVEPGEQVLQLSEGIHEKDSSEIIDFKVSIEEGARYRLTKENGKPILQKVRPNDAK